MTLDDYRVLKEIESHKASLLSLRQGIAAQEERLSKIDQMIDTRQSELTINQGKLKELRLQIQKLENELETNSKNLESSNERIASLTDENQIQANQKQIESLTQKIEELEAQAFELMEQVEALEAEVNEAETFLEGIPKSRSEIEHDVVEIKTNNEKEISTHQSRIKSLLENIPQQLKDRYMIVHRKFKDKVAIAELQNDYCSTCGFEVSRPLQTEINSLREIANCSGCGRLILPHEL